MNVLVIVLIIELTIHPTVQMQMCFIGISCHRPA